MLLSLHRRLGSPYARVPIGTMMQQLGVTLTHQPMAAGTHETGILPSMLEQLLLAESVVTLDTAHTPPTAEAIVQEVDDRREAVDYAVGSGAGEAGSAAATPLAPVNCR